MRTSSRSSRRAHCEPRSASWPAPWPGAEWADCGVAPVPSAAMEHVRWVGDRPELHDPILLVAFEGWSDAGDAASTALRWLRDRWAAEPLAEIDGEEFYDFSETRPQVRLDGDVRTIEWPCVELTWGSDAGRDIVALSGSEPHTRWKTFSRQVLDVA